MSLVEAKTRSNYVGFEKQLIFNPFLTKAVSSVKWLLVGTWSCFGSQNLSSGNRQLVTFANWINGKGHPCDSPIHIY